MNAFLKLDRCCNCRQELSWEWVPPILLSGRPLAGTGVWRSALTDGRCPACFESHVESLARETKARLLRQRFVAEVGVVPYRDFTFERFRVHRGNQVAFEPP
jgi:hypothetical protein